MGMKRYYHGLWVAVVVFSALAQAAPTYINDGLMTWQRGVDGSTWQEWTFDNKSDEKSVTPEQYYNPYGNPTIAFTNGSVGGAGEDSVAFGWENGAWQGDPIWATVTVPNSPQANPTKTIWYEMVYKAVDSVLPSVSAGQQYDVTQTYFSDCAYSDQWRIMTIGWTISPNPTLETFTFALAGTGGFVSSVSVDTLCAPVPEPTSMLLVSVGLGAVGLIRKKLF